MNIFARELSAILGNHRKELSSLYTMKSNDGFIRIPPSRVTRLKRSLTDNSTVTLNAEQLEMLQEQVPLDKEELRRLRAAVLAESVHYLLAGRMNVDDAYRIAELAFQLLISTDPEQMRATCDQILDRTRAVPTEIDFQGEVRRGVTGQVAVVIEASEEQIAKALEAATDTCEQGVLWLEVARDTPDYTMRRGYVAQALKLLHEARKAAEYPESVAMHSSQQQELLVVIDAALADALLLS